MRSVWVGVRRDLDYISRYWFTFSAVEGKILTMWGVKSDFDAGWFAKLDTPADKLSVSKGRNVQILFHSDYAMVTELQVHYKPVYKERPKNPEPTEAAPYSILSIQGKHFYKYSTPRI